MENENNLFKQKTTNEIDILIEKTEHVRSELFSIYQMEYALLTGIAIGRYYKKDIKHRSQSLRNSTDFVSLPV